MPAPPPAAKVYQYVLMHNTHHSIVPMRFVAAEAGFLPPGPFTFFADIAGDRDWLKRVTQYMETAEAECQKVRRRRYKVQEQVLRRKLSITVVQAHLEG